MFTATTASSTAPATDDAAAHIALLRDIQNQIQSGQRHIRWDCKKPFTDADKQRRIRGLTWGIYASIPLIWLALGLMYVYVPDIRDMLPLIAGVMLVAEAVQLLWVLPWAKRKLQQQTHQDMRVQIDRQRQRVTVGQAGGDSRMGQTYTFHTTPSHPSDLHLLGGAPQQPTAEHMRLYRDVQNALQHTTGLVFA